MQTITRLPLVDQVNLISDAMRMAERWKDEPHLTPSERGHREDTFEKLSYLHKCLQDDLRVALEEKSTGQ